MLRNIDRLIFVGLVTAFVLSSCGLFIKQKDDGGGAGPVQPPQLIVADDVMLLSPEDPACMNSGKSVSVNTAKVWLWNGTETVETSVKLNATPGEDEELASLGTLGALWDLQFSKTCTGKSGSVTCKDPKITKQPGIVKICRSNGSYGRESIESMTLTTQYMSDLTRAFYYKLPSSTDGLLKAVLYIQPQELWHVTETSTGRKGDLMKADNAAFAASSTEKKYGVFWVYPTSKESFAKNPVHLWEAPFVMRHEFGHNVFNHHVGTAAEKIGLNAIDFADTFASASIMRGAPRAHQAGFSLDSSEQAQNDLNGLNETFADLFAYYGGDAKLGQLKGLGDSLDTTRDPGSQRTMRGTQKVWTTKEANIYSGLMAPDASLPKTEPDFTDEHDVAAVFGYNMAALIDKAMQGSTSIDKANVLILWANALADHLNSRGKEATLDSMTAEFVRIIMDHKVASTSDACAAFAKSMSGLPESVAACK